MAPTQLHADVCFVGSGPLGVVGQVEDAVHGGQGLGGVNLVGTAVTLPQKQPSPKAE